MAKYTLDLNGQQQTVEVAEDTPLLWVLRDHLNLVGTKYGCGIAQCGACTVHLEGNAVRSCSLPVAAVAGKKITTIETVEILNENKGEAIYYFQNNWKILREKAIEKDYISSFQLMETLYSTETPFHIILVTTYSNKKQFENREKHFRELIKTSGDLKLLNNKKPSEFRKSVFSVESAKHLE